MDTLKGRCEACELMFLLVVSCSSFNMQVRLRFAWNSATDVCSIPFTFWMLDCEIVVLVRHHKQKTQGSHVTLAFVLYIHLPKCRHPVSHWRLCYQQKNVFLFHSLSLSLNPSIDSAPRFLSWSVSLWVVENLLPSFLDLPVKENIKNTLNCFLE